MRIILDIIYIYIPISFHIYIYICRDIRYEYGYKATSNNLSVELSSPVVIRRGPHFRNQTICLRTGSMAFTVSATCCEF